MAHPAPIRSRAPDVERPPTRLLVVAAISVVLGAVFVAFDEFALHVIGYFLASFQTIGLLAAYTRIDAGLRQHAGYVPLSNATRITSVLALAGVIVAALNVWLIATELAG
jgi:hypothetical protein